MNFFKWVETQLDAFYRYRLERAKCHSCEILASQLEDATRERDRLISKLTTGEVVNEIKNAPSDEAEDDWDVLHSSRLGSSKRNKLMRDGFQRSETLRKEFEQTKLDAQNG